MISPRQILRGDLPPRQRALLLRGAVLVVALLVAVPAILVSTARRSRQRLEKDVALLQVQLTQDRRSRLALEKAIAGERHRIAELSIRQLKETREQLEALRAEEARIETELEETRARSSKTLEEIARLQEGLREGTRQLQAAEEERSQGERVIKRYQGGVGLIEGEYRFTDAAGRPVRKGTGEGAGLSVDGAGPVLEQRFFGTGFLVSKDGLVATNRHIAEPWWRDAEDEELIGRGWKPRLTRLRIFFPGIEEPFGLGVVRVSETADVALLKTPLGRHKVPVLELGREGPPAAGQPVVLLGYPSGLDALLARLDDQAVQSILATSGTSDESLAMALSRQRMIRPLATQGHLGDVLPHQLVYDAQTTSGGSGGPVFDVRGKVIGVNHAILSDFAAVGFGVPISRVLELLPPAPRPAIRRPKGSG